MTTRIDARGMRCPWPAIRLARALRDAGPGSEIEILADDPAAPRELERAALQAGAAFVRSDFAKFVVRMAPE
ncbi:sulfurtransferase TusA family protein [Sphingosinithalassobacter portus]|uniref:sulfurtransferase TusA family protein n=1 Tax=Stakelama portus TaxID=2676234 RepID=UPI000D6DC5DC|nr:sulfurtransferase TusA family protein [Sphingosinithalassobacter portus]